MRFDNLSGTAHGNVGLDWSAFQDFVGKLPDQETIDCCIDAMVDGELPVRATDLQLSEPVIGIYLLHSDDRRVLPGWHTFLPRRITAANATSARVAPIQIVATSSPIEQKLLRRQHRPEQVFQRLPATALAVGHRFRQRGGECLQLASVGSRLRARRYTRRTASASETCSFSQASIR